MSAWWLLLLVILAGGTGYYLWSRRIKSPRQVVDSVKEDLGRVARRVSQTVQPAQPAPVQPVDASVPAASAHRRRYRYQ